MKAYVKDAHTLRLLAGSDLSGRFFGDYQERFFKTFLRVQGDGTPDYAALNAPEAEAKVLGRGEGMDEKAD